MSYLKPVNEMTPAEIQKIRAAAINSAIAEAMKYRHASVEEMVTDALDLKPVREFIKEEKNDIRQARRKPATRTRKSNLSQDV